MSLESQDALSESKRYSLRFAPNMALNGIVAPLLVMPALTRTPLLSNGTYATVVLPRHPNSDLACATAIGYMAFDLGAMLIGYKASIKSNGAAMFHLYVWHHLLSILFWPVAILNNAFVFFVDWFVASEMSSPWLAVRGAMLTLGTINTPLGILVQLAFVATFFLGRIWVMPDLVLSLRCSSRLVRRPCVAGEPRRVHRSHPVHAQHILGTHDRALRREGGLRR